MGEQVDRRASSAWTLAAQAEALRKARATIGDIGRAREMAWAALSIFELEHQLSVVATDLRRLAAEESQLRGRLLDRGARSNDWRATLEAYHATQTRRQEDQQERNQLAAYLEARLRSSVTRARTEGVTEPDLQVIREAKTKVLSELARLAGELEDVESQGTRLRDSLEHDPDPRGPASQALAAQAEAPEATAAALKDQAARLKQELGDLSKSEEDAVNAELRSSATAAIRTIATAIDEIAPELQGLAYMSKWHPTAVGRLPILPSLLRGLITQLTEWRRLGLINDHDEHT